MDFKSGFVALIGLPNVGKSTLINALLKKKVSIVTPKPQTTRNKIIGVYNTPTRQIIFVDTPGIHKQKNNLDKFMDKSIESAVSDVDLILLLVDASKVLYEQIAIPLKKIDTKKIPTFLVVNKVDESSIEKLYPQIDKLKDNNSFKQIVFISAKKRQNLDVLLELIDPYLSDTIKYYQDDDLNSKKNDEFLVSEIIREKALYLIREEIPHGIGIKVDKMEKEDGILNIYATIYCDKQSHKSIIIGKNGQMLKNIGQRARQELEKIFNTKIYMELWVKVKEHWKDSNSLLNELGFNSEDIW